MKRAVYPGTFDPPTKGHEDIARRALKVFDEVIIGVADNTSKYVLFSKEERVRLWQEIFPNEPRLQISSFGGLAVNFARENNAQFIVRGLRAISDFEYELQIASTNRGLDPSIDTIFFTAQEGQMFVSSTTVKELARFGACTLDKAPEVVCRALKQKFFPEKDPSA